MRLIKNIPIIFFVILIMTGCREKYGTDNVDTKEVVEGSSYLGTDNSDIEDSQINGERDINQLITDLEISEYQYPENFNMDDDLRALLENCAIYYSDYDNSRSIDEEWEQGFIHNFCQNSWFGFDYLNSISDDDKSTISKDQVEYVQYSFSGNLIEFKSIKKEDPIAIDEASSGFSYAELLDFEAEDKGDVIDLSMTFSISNAAEGSVEKMGKATLIKNSYSCFGGYSIKTFVLNSD